MRNGDMVRLAPGPAEIVDEAPVGRLFRDGELLVPSEDGPVRERRSLAFAGIVIVALARSGRGRDRRRRDRARRRAGRGRRGAQDGRHRPRCGGGHASPAFPATRRRDGELVREAVRRAVRSAVEHAWGKRPIAKVLLAQAPALSGACLLGSRRCRHLAGRVEARVGCRSTVARDARSRWRHDRTPQPRRHCRAEPCRRRGAVSRHAGCRGLRARGPARAWRHASCS